MVHAADDHAAALLAGALVRRRWCAVLVTTRWSRRIPSAGRVTGQDDAWRLEPVD
jgi:hypothetical protein